MSTSQESRKDILSDVEALLRVLRGQSGWLTSGQLERLLGWSPRYVSAIASRAGGAVLSTTRGYRCALCASDAEALESWGEIYRRALHTYLRCSAIVHFLRQRGRLLRAEELARQQNRIQAEVAAGFQGRMDEAEIERAARELGQRAEQLELIPG